MDAISTITFSKSGSSVRRSRNRSKRANFDAMISLIGTAGDIHPQSTFFFLLLCFHRKKRQPASSSGSSAPLFNRFRPSDEELQGTMMDVDLHIREAWDLPEMTKLSLNEWYFFSFRDRKYATGSRTNRVTKSGYWKAIWKDLISYNSKKRMVIRMKKDIRVLLRKGSKWNKN